MGFEPGDLVRFPSPFGGMEQGRIEELDEKMATVIATSDETLFVIAVKDMELIEKNRA